MKNYGQIIPNLIIHGEPAEYGVVNERSIRATAGIMYALGFFAFFNALFLENRTYLSFLVPIFWFDFFLKTVFGPQYSYLGWIGKLVTLKQKPEYVGAIQKRFAWGIGLTLSSIMMISLFVLQYQGMVNLLICGTCLLFMWLESAAGICVGCKIYNFLLNKKLLPAPVQKPACPGGACSIKKT